MKKIISILLAVSISLMCFISCDSSTDTDEAAKETGAVTTAEEEVRHNEEGLSPEDIPAYSGSPYIAVNNNQPLFKENELIAKGYERYSSLDDLGRCRMAVASLGFDTMPGEGVERGSIRRIKPSGWNQAFYDNVQGEALYNRCHLIGWQLSAENDNRANLITGTRYFNVEGMLPFENMVADYIRETGNHVAYRVTPLYNGDDLVASGVQIEAMSVEDGGEGIMFNVFCYNVQPGITIDYATGASYSGNAPVQNETADIEYVYITPTGSKYHFDPACGGKNSYKTTMEEALQAGLTPCKKCAY